MALTDEFDLVGGHGPADRPAPPAPARHRRWRERPAPWFGAAVALVLVGALTAPPVPLVVGRGEGPDTGQLDLPLTEPPTVLWQTELTAATGLNLGDDHLLALIGDPGTGQTVVALDIDTGVESWRLDDADGTCQLLDVVACVSAADTDDAVIVTVADDGTQQRLAHPWALLAMPSGEDLVVVERTDADRLEAVVLVEPDGTQRWRVEADAVDGEPDAIWPTFHVDDDHVGLYRTGELIDLETGDVTAGDVHVLGSSTTIVTDDGHVVELEVDEWPIGIDDDVGGPVVLRTVESTVIVATVRGSGDELWRLDRTYCYPWMRQQGSIVFGCWGQTGTMTLVALDEVTGQPVWETERDGLPLTAGAEAILVTTSEPSQIVALDPVDGAELWHLPFDGSSFANAYEVEDGLLIWSDRATVRLAW